MKVRKALYVLLGCLGLALGAVGAVVPLMPAFPFLMLAAWSFARSSDRLHQWFINTGLYKNNLESFVQGRGMTKAAKVRVMLTITLVMGIGAYMMRRIPVGQIILAVIWVGHILLFTWGIRTIQE